MFTRILVPLDGSPLAEAILPEVVDLARLHGAEVLLLRVALVHALPSVDQTEAQVRAVEEAEGYLAEIERRLAAQGLPVRGAVRYGRAVEEILDHAQWQRADLIAMSTHGRSGIQRFMLGSVAEAVVRAAPVPVLLLRGRTLAVRQEAAEARPCPAELAAPAIHHILCPVDFSECSDRAMEYAGALAQRFGADLTVLHVVYDPLDVTGSHIPHPPLEQLREEMVREAEHTLHDRVDRTLHFLPRAKIAVVAGSPFRQIIHYAREHHMDLIVMGTQGLRGLDRLIMGSTAERVVRTAPCPVVSIRAAA
ncbi:MAG: universal stress protein [candidate division NC10 bacterium]|nr:universal stress protein [candidate division NC10 bacterium]